MFGRGLRPSELVSLKLQYIKNISIMEIRVTEEQLDAVVGVCIEAEENGTTKWPGMTYEQGVKAALEWVQGYGEHPLED